MDLSLDLQLILRIVVGTILGAVIGYERDIHGRPAGLRTHALVALASATFMVVSSHMADFQNYTEHGVTEIDGSRIAASVVSGIGFLAGGAILRTGLSVQGLTTAAGLWLVAAIGLCAGAGMYAEAVAVTLLGIGALTTLRRFEDKDDQSIKRHLAVTLSSDAPTNHEIMETLGQICTLTLEGWERDATASTRHLRLAVRLPREGGEARLVAALEGVVGVVRMQLGPLPH